MQRFNVFNEILDALGTYLEEVCVGLKIRIPSVENYGGTSLHLKEILKGSLIQTHSGET